MNNEELERAYLFSSNNKPALEHDTICGCFNCLKIFDPKELSYVQADNDCDRLGTAVCPYCSVDSVIGASSGFPITEEFLSEMRKKFFPEYQLLQFFQ